MEPLGFTLLLEELLPSALAARLDAAEPSPALRRAEETAKRRMALVNGDYWGLGEKHVKGEKLTLGSSFNDQYPAIIHALYIKL